MTIHHATSDWVMANWRPGSYDEHPDGGRPWTWADETADLEARGELDSLVSSIREVGVLHPVLLGDDGTVWGGHHRIVAAARAGVLVPYEVHPDAEVATAHEMAL